MDVISRAWLKEAIHNFFNGLTHEVTEEDIQRYIEVAPSAFEGKTNGEVIQTLFPNETMFEQTETCTYYGNMRFDTDWWNAPYKGVSK